jgi:hypothetical protein
MEFTGTVCQKMPNGQAPSWLSDDTFGIYNNGALPSRDAYANLSRPWSYWQPGIYIFLEMIATSQITLTKT